MSVDLGSRYWGSFIGCAALCFFLQIYSRATASKSIAVNGQQASQPQQQQANQSRFKAFQANYLLVFMLAMFSDWLQGPYVYELYVSYGFNQQQIAELFVCGFGSSMIVGTFAGSLADTLGRRLMCVAYCVTYILGCLSKTVPEYWTLMVGRFLSGISTSLLFSVFESWMVGEHFKQGFDSSSLGDTFAFATFGNGLVAVIAGLVANSAAVSFGTPLAPFLVAIFPLILVAVIITSSWAENYGNAQMSMLSSMSKAFDLIRSDWRIASLGMAQSCFEGAMYAFVFMWTPALKAITIGSGGEVGGHGSSKDIDPNSQYLGLIFSVFMVCVMVGSSVFKMVSGRRDQLYRIPLALHAIAFVSMISVAVFFETKIIVYSMFLIFEITVGLFYPSYGMIKSEKIPEDIRSAVMSIFRMPLNAFVVLLLLKIKFMQPQTVFLICAGAHLVSLLCYLYFFMTSRTDKLEGKELGKDEEQGQLLVVAGNSKDSSV